MTRCPSSAELGKWLAGGLAAADAAAVEAHVETCAGCRQALEQLTRYPDDDDGGEKNEKSRHHR